MQYRDAAGIKRKLRLGQHPDLPLAGAVRAARQRLTAIAAGADPAKERREARVEAGRLLRFGEIVNRYLVATKPKVSAGYHDDLTRYLQRDHLRSLHRVAAVELDQAALASAIDKVRPRGDATAQQAIAALGSALKWAAGQGLVSPNTYYAARLIPKPVKHSRDRVLSMKELTALWAAADPATSAGKLVRLLTLTGLRREEAGALHSDEVDREAGLVRLGADRMKAGEKHVVPIVGVVGSLLPEREGFLFGRTPEVPFSGWSKVKARLDEAMARASGQVEPWVIHDLRHTVSTHLNEEPDANPDLIDRLLGHKRKGTEAIYNHARLVEGRKRLLLQWQKVLRRGGVL